MKTSRMARRALPIILALAHACGVAQAHEPAVPPLVIQAGRVTLLDLAPVGPALLAVGERGIVGRSDDGGQSWQLRQAPTSRTLTALAFVNDKVGVAVGHGGTVLRTEDGGATWIAIPIKEIGHDAVLGVTALKNGQIVACGAFGMYLVSEDVGRTWRRRSVVEDNFERHISRVVETSHGLFLVGETGTLARSTDGGARWTLLKSPYEGSYFGLLEARGGALLAYGMRGNVYRSTDQGNSWEHVPFSSKATINGGSVSADGRIVLAGNRGLLAVSTDDGRSFSTLTAPEGTSLSQARLLDDGALAYAGVMATGRMKPASFPNGRATSQ
jgi:photosystem II stability/assembly factor-like uncharacterized protein